MTKSQRQEDRMIHIRIPRDIHRLLRIRTAEDDVTIQEWVSPLIIESLKRDSRRKRQ